MADKFLNLTGLQHYHGKVETIFAGSMEIVGKTVTLKSKSGAVLSTITLPSQAYELARRPYVPGICLRKLYDASGKPKVWFFYFVLPWPLGLFKTKCIRGSLGWKLWCKESTGHGIAMWTGMINPFFSRE